MAKKNKNISKKDTENSIDINKDNKENITQTSENTEKIKTDLKTSLASLIAKEGKRISFLFGFVFIVILALLFIKQNFVPMSFGSGDISSNYNNGATEIKNEPEYNGVFTYGPYISLNSGTYKLTALYESDVDIEIQCTRDYGVRELARDVLPAGKGKHSFEFKLGEDMKDKSFEVRTAYRGHGSFAFKGFTIESTVSNNYAVVYILSFAILVGLCFYVFSKNTQLLMGAILYLGLIHVFLFSSAARNLLYVFVGFLVYSALVFLVGKSTSFVKKNIKNANIKEELALGVFSSYIASSLIAVKNNSINIDTIAFINNVDVPLFLLIAALIFNVLLFIRLLTTKKQLVYIFSEIVVIIFAFMLITHNNRSIYFTAGITALVGIFTYYLCRNDNLGMDKIKINDKVSFGIVALAYLIFAGVFSIATVYRYKTFGASNFDFGIFAQMYENMAKTGMPVTTVERNELMSHFYIHFSPIYYILLPIYFIFRTPETLLVCQSCIAGAGVFPLYLLCKKKNEGKNLQNILISLTFLCLPAISAPLYYDFHENAFLPPMLLFMLYFFEVKKYKPMYIFMVLSLFIKEDAAIYVFAIALYEIFAKKEYKHGIIVFLATGVYFGAVMAAIAHFGKGLMDSHYGMYYLSGEKGVVTMFKNMALAPGLVLSTCFNGDTVEFLLYTLGVLLFVPLLNKKIWNFTLIIPFLLINLVTSYSYQHQIGYQYVFGTVSLLMYLYCLNIENLSVKIKNTVIITVLVGSALSVYTYKGDLFYSKKAYDNNPEIYESNEALLKRIPYGVSITSETFLLPHLVKHEKLYMYKYEDEFTDYYAMQKNGMENYEGFTDRLKAMGYTLEAENARITIFKSPTAPALN
ncbi:MAG: DUF2079 domain-containing protein [Firmicutes bacterium]|nr:DUF2079 domain-containing protein [Bacillota bacterium]